MDSDVQRFKRKKSDDKVDWISELSDDVLLLILSRLSTEEAIRTSVVSKRWEHVWKKLPHLVLNTRRRFNPDAELTRVINNLDGDLESCAITHSPHECISGPLNTWIHSLIWMKHTKNLTLHNDIMYHLPNLISSFFPRCSLSHPSLMSLSLNSYYLASSRPFRNCSNIKILKLLYIYSPEIGVFNNILAFCPSLEVLVLNKIECSDPRRKSFILKIENTKLKFLEMTSIKGIDKVIVSAPSLDILVAKNTFLMRREFLLQSPNLQFSKDAKAFGWITLWFHIIYNISKEKNCGHEELVNRIGEFDFRREQCAILSVAVDLMNQTEVERLRQVLCLWPNFNDSTGIEIKFKGNNVPSSSEEIECWQKKLWVENDHEDSFPSAKFRVNFVLIYNFKGSKEEIAFVSCLIRQGKVKRSIMLRPKSFSTSNRSNIEAAVAKLQEVQSEDHQKVPEIELI